jgi:hypothetical protein
LTLKGVHWLGQGQGVQVVSTWGSSLAACHHIYHQMLQTAGPTAAGRVKLHTFDLWTGGQSERDAAVTAAVTALMSEVQDGQLFLIADEVYQ